MKIVPVNTSILQNIDRLNKLDRKYFPNDILESKKGNWWVVVKDGKWVGLIGGREISGYYRLLRVGIHKNIRGQGIGKRLVKKFLKEVKNRGYSEVRAYVYFKNFTSMNLLMRCGFRVYGIMKDTQFLKWKWKV